MRYAVPYIRVSHADEKRGLTMDLQLDAPARTAIDLVEQAKPIMHYVASDMAPFGKAVRISARGIFPEVWLFNPDDFERQRLELARYARVGQCYRRPSRTFFRET